MSQPKRNPIIGAITAVVLIGYGGYRILQHLQGVEVLPIWRVLMLSCMVAYGGFLVYSLIKDRQNQE